MKKLILRLLLFSLLGYLGGEIVVRHYQLVPDIPRRFVDKNGIQRYIPGQKGLYKGGKHSWQINESGWPGVANINKKTNIAIIGDSFIENMANPITSNQGYLLQQAFPGAGFIEAGRSGVTFIEALEISKALVTEFAPTHCLIYVSTNDFLESLVSCKRFKDRMQIDLKSETILKGELKATGVKNILYRLKFLYYLYLRFPIFVKDRNKGVLSGNNELQQPENFQKIRSLLEFSIKNYDFSKIVLVFHPETDRSLISLIKSLNINSIELKEEANKSWKQSKKEIHWTVDGHEQAAKQVSVWLKDNLRLDN